LHSFVLLPSSHSLFNAPPTADIYTFPYTTLFRSSWRNMACLRTRMRRRSRATGHSAAGAAEAETNTSSVAAERASCSISMARPRSEEHTSELQSRENLVCRLLLEKKKK